MNSLGESAAQASFDEKYMQLALDQARAAARSGEVPVGCVIVRGDQVISHAANRSICDCDPTAHAEMVALRAAAGVMKNYRLSGATLYVSIEPCAMCAGAMLQARIERLVYGADDPKGGAVRSCFAVFDHPRVNHRVNVTAGVLAGDAAALLREFFEARR
jgi:tRNA(adenine34) deaminase